MRYRDLRVGRRFVGRRHRVAPVPNRLDPQVDEVRRTGELDDREQDERLRHDRADADRDRDDQGEHPERVAEHAEETAQAAERDRPADHEEHARPRDHDQRQRGEREREERGRRNHPVIVDPAANGGVRSEL